MKLAVVGYGRMGRAVEALAAERGHRIVAKVDAGDDPGAAAAAGAEVALEFTQPEAAPVVLEALARAGVPTVSGTTGWYEHLEAVREAFLRSGAGFVYAPNFSVGVALFRRIVSEASRLMDRVEEYDVALREVHHAAKRDHPSGTARLLAEEIVSAVRRKERWAEAPPTGGAGRETLWVSVAREGNVPGTHEVTFDGPEDRILLRHEARSRSVFAGGALLAAEWLPGKRGVFTFEEVLADRFGL